MNSLHKIRRILVSTGLLAVFTFIYLNGTRISSRFGDNSSYLSDTSYFGGQLMTFKNFLFGTGRFNSMARFESLYAEYENKRNYGLLDANTERLYYDEFTRLSFSALEDFQKYHAGQIGNSALAALEDESKSGVSSLKTPAAVLSLVALMYAGRPISYRLTPDIKLKSQTQIRDNKMNEQRLGVDTSYVNTSMTYHATPSPSALYSDTVRAGVSKDVAWGGGGRAGAEYGVNTGSLTLSVSKKVTERVSVSYDHAELGQNKGTNHAVGLGFSAGF